MEVIVPAAGLSTRFPGLKPKYLLQDIDGRLMIENSIRPYLDRYPITIGILAEHNAEWNSIAILKQRMGSSITIVELPEITRGPADTVNQIINAKYGESPPSTSMLVKDCDSYFTHDIANGNYMCVEYQPQIGRRLHNKSYCRIDCGDTVLEVVEKSPVSAYYNVGGYHFQSIGQYYEWFQSIATAGSEVFVSDVINRSLRQGESWRIQPVSDYTDVGTLEDWSNRRL